MTYWTLPELKALVLKLNKEKFNLCLVIEQLLDDFQIRVDSGKLKLFFEPCNIEVYADKARVIQVISNILDNAIKFTVQGIISVSTELVNSNVNVSVRDTGTGIDCIVFVRDYSLNLQVVRRPEQVWVCLYLKISWKHMEVRCGWKTLSNPKAQYLLLVYLWQTLNIVIEGKKT